MRPSKLIPSLPSLTLAAFLALAPCAAQTRQSSRGASGRGVRAVLFAVSRDGESGAGSIDPIVVIEGGRYTPPPSDAAFTGDYFRPGRAYTVLFGGGRAGSVKVLAYTESAEGCVVSTAEAEVRTAARRGLLKE